MSQSVRRQVVAVALAGLVLATVAVALPVLAQPSPCCRVKDPYISLYNRPLSRVEAVLAQGDGQAFGAIAQDPLLARPAVIGSPADYAYRAQRPLWSYLSWVASLGQPNLVAWAMAVLTILSGAFATLVTALLFIQRRLSPWWAVVVPLVGMPALTGYTPELAAFGLFAAGVLLWSHRQNRLAVATLCLAVLTRESLLIGVAALALWELTHNPRTLRSLRHLSQLGLPVVAYGAWIAVLYLRLGTLPYQNSNARLGLPGLGLATTLVRSNDPTTILARALVAALLAIGAVALARHDVLTWITVGFAVFASLLGPDVWQGGGLLRTALPLYALGFVAVLGGYKARHTSEPATPRTTVHAIRGLASAQGART